MPLQVIHARFWPAITRRAAASSVAPVASATALPASLHRLVLATQKLDSITWRGTSGADQGHLGRSGQVGRRDPAARRGLTSACASPAAQVERKCTLSVPPGADAELHRLAGARNVEVLRLRRGRRRDLSLRRAARAGGLRRRDRVAREAVRRRDRGTRKISPEAEQQRRRRERLGEVLKRATAFYERVLWESELRRVRARDLVVARARPGRVQEVPARPARPRGATLSRARGAGGIHVARRLLAAGLS